MEDPYKVLGIARGAGEADIKKAYRRLARKLHPDLHPGEPRAEARFKEVTAAHDLLADPEKRRAYDAGEIDAGGQPRAERAFYRAYADSGSGGKYNDPRDFLRDLAGGGIFADLFRGTARRPGDHARFRGADISYGLEIDFLDAVKGGVKRITMPGSKRLKVTIPPGSENGQVLRLKGQGMAGAGDGPPGDANIELRVRAHEVFVRKDRDIHMELPITLPEAVLGAKIQVPTVHGPVTMTVPKGANSGSTLRLKGRGVPRPGGGRPGDQYVTLKVVLPDPPDGELTRLVREWAESHPYSVRGGPKGAA